MNVEQGKLITNTDLDKCGGGGNEGIYCRREESQNENDRNLSGKLQYVLH